MESVEFVLVPSRYLYYFFLLISVILIGVISLLPVLIIIKIISAILVILYLKNIIINHALKSKKNSIQRIVQDSEGKWGYFTQEGKLRRCTILEDSYISNLLIILRLKSKTLKKTSSLLIPFDSLSEAENRTIRLRLLSMRKEK